MSPEQARGGEIDGRSDLFSCGVVLYEMVTGRLPFTGPTPVAVFESLLTRVPPPPSSLAAVPAEFDRIVAKALEKDRELRYQTAADLRGDLKRLKRGSDSASAPVAATTKTTDVPAPPAAARRRMPWSAVATAVAVVAAVGVGLFLYTGRTRAFSERDPVVIADLVNTTGEPVFDGTLKEALDVQPRQSPYLGVLPDQRVQGTLRLMGRRPDEKLTREIARDICQRTASKAMIGGTISQLGQSYVISLDATNCRTGDTIEKTQVQAATKDGVLKALGSATAELRGKLGESLASIGKYDAPIQDATTASLDALKSYSVGMTTRRRDGDAASLPFLRRAIERDDNFALAHARLSTVYGNLGESSLAREEITKAYALRERVSEPERLYITARYASIVEGSTQKTIETYLVWVQTYPNDYVPRANLAGAYESRGDHDKAIEEYRTAIRLAPDEPLSIGNLAGIYTALNRPDEARRVVEEGIGRGLDSIGFRSELYTLAFFRHDEAEMAKQLAASRKLTEGFRMLQAQAFAAVYEGRLARARALCDQFTSEAATRIGPSGSAAGLWSNLAQGAATVGDADATRASVKRSLTLERNVGTLLNNAFALIVVRDVAEAQRLSAEAATLPGADTPDAQKGFTLIATLVKWRQGDPSAVDEIPPPKDDTDISGMFLNGVVNLDSGNAQVAADRFKQTIDHGGLLLTVLKPVAPLFYGRALAKLGKIDDSRKAYEQFFQNFAHADASLPLLAAARQEYARLKPSS